VRAAIERQARALRDRREPEEAFGDGQTALQELRVSLVDVAGPRAGRPATAHGRAGWAVERHLCSPAFGVTAPFPSYW
jgi:hypothetical protein